MVVFLDLEDDVEPPEQTDLWAGHHESIGILRHFGRGAQLAGKEKEVERPNPNRELGITKALGCYP